MNGAELIQGEPVVGYRETVIKESRMMMLSKSPNKHNRIFGEAYPLSSELQAEIEAGTITPQPKDQKEQAKYVFDKFGTTEAFTFDSDDILPKKLWGFGPDGKGPNWIMDATRAVQYLSEIKDSVVNGFTIVTKGGPFCEESCRGVMVRVLDVTMHADSIHRGMGQILPAARSLICAAMYTANPTLMEPLYLAEITVPVADVGGVYSTLALRRGEIIEEVPRPGTPMTFIRSYLPVNESFGFTTALRAATGGKAFPQCVFDHWQQMGGDVFIPCKVHDIIKGASRSDERSGGGGCGCRWKQRRRLARRLPPPPPLPPPPSPPPSRSRARAQGPAPAAAAGGVQRQACVPRRPASLSSSAQRCSPQHAPPAATPAATRPPPSRPPRAV